MDTHEFFYYLIAAFILGIIPVVGKYVAVINTFLHEVGHALIAYLLGGRVHSISLFANTEGTAVTAHSGRVDQNLRLCRLSIFVFLWICYGLGFKEWL